MIILIFLAKPFDASTFPGLTVDHMSGERFCCYWKCFLFILVFISFKNLRFCAIVFVVCRFLPNIMHESMELLELVVASVNPFIKAFLYSAIPTWKVLKSRNSWKRYKIVKKFGGRRGVNPLSPVNHSFDECFCSIRIDQIPWSRLFSVE